MPDPITMGEWRKSRGSINLELGMTPEEAKDIAHRIRSAGVEAQFYLQSESELEHEDSGWVRYEGIALGDATDGWRPITFEEVRYPEALHEKEARRARGESFWRGM